MQMSNVDEQEIKKFSDIANEWWNKDGDFKPLHIINPLRANYIKEKIELALHPKTTKREIEDGDL